MHTVIVIGWEPVGWRVEPGSGIKDMGVGAI